MEIQKQIPSNKLKSTLITRTAIKTLKSEALVEKVINHQFQEIYKALGKYREVEISGFGKFLISPSKCKAKYIKTLERIKEAKEKLEKGGLTEYQIEQQHKIIEVAKGHLAHIKTKVDIYELIPDIRRLEEQIIPTRRNKGNNTESIPGEDGNLQELPVQLYQAEGTNSKIG